MSNSNSNNSFSHAFLPGLILGLIVGGVAGAFLPDFFGGPKIPVHKDTNGDITANPTDRDGRGTDTEYDEETQRIIDDAMKDAQENTDDAAEVIQDLEEEASDLTPPTTPPSDG